ncbi:MAG: extracellular solute-binding protein [Chloroflexi bacterium]|nr:extracellular solute-binding protein [Chloroflexota bacterium]
MVRLFTPRVWLAAVMLLATACTTAAPATPPPASKAATTETKPAEKLGGTLTVYSARKEDLMKPLVSAFQQASGVQVTLKSGAPGELALLIEQEKGSPRGDVFFTTDAAGTELLRQKGLLESYASPNAAKVPPEFKAADGSWTGVIGRSRNIMFNTTQVAAGDTPGSVFDLTQPRWKGKVAMASIREGGVRLWLASLLLERGEEFTMKYVDDLKANGVKVLANHTEVANAVARGEAAVGLVNHYYYVPKAKEGASVGLIYPDQGANEIGTLVTPLTVAILKGAANSAQARAFVDFALSPAGQEPLTTQEQEFPLVPGVALGAATAPGVKPIDQIKRPQMDWVKLSEAEKRAVQMFTPVLGG